jgi:surface antigen
MAGFVYNLSKHYSNRLSEDDSRYHSKAVYFALNSLETGEAAEWFNDRTHSHGKAQIKLTWMASGNTCRAVYSYVISDKKMFSYNDKACYNNSTKTWDFIE